jgi:signal transduction histidine kinase
MRIVRHTMSHAGERLDKLSFDTGHHPHSVFHPDCDGVSCALMNDWNAAWTAHLSGLPVEWLHLSNHSDVVLKFRLQPVSYACSVLFDSRIEDFSGHSVLFVQDLTRPEEENDQTATSVHVKNAQIYERRRKSDGDPDLVASLDERLRLVTRRLLESRDAIRKRLAADLHDSLGQTLSLLRLEIESVIAKPQIEDHILFLEHTLERVTRAQQELRHLTGKLHGELDSSSGLRDSLLALAADFRGAKPDIELSVDLDGVCREIPAELGVTIYRIAQESLNNVIRHSRARTALLSLRSDDSGVQLLIQDDGIGMADCCIPRRGLGMITMRERAENQGGTYETDCPTGQGCTIRANWPREVVVSLR